MKTLHWKTPTGYCGHGSPMDNELAQAWLLYSVELHDGLIYWLEDATP